MCDCPSGVESLVHVAAPTYVGGNYSAAEIIKGATDGTINIIKYALNANVKKVVYTSTIAALFHCMLSPYRGLYQQVAYFALYISRLQQCHVHRASDNLIME